MQLSFVLLSALLLSAVGASPAPQAAATKEYIIKLRRGVSQSKITELVSRVGVSDNKIKRRFDPKFFNGVVGSFTPQFVAQLKGNKDIEYYERNGLMHALGSQASPPSWGLTRVSEKKLDLTAPYNYPDSAGKGVDVWIVDTGIQFDNSDFGGRAELNATFVPTEKVPDGNGHGTHCSGTIGSTTYGVAKLATLHGVKVLNGMGSGTYEAVIAGIQQVAKFARPGKTVMSMSLGGPKSQAVDDAINAAFTAGVASVVAAGNSNNDACTLSPAGADKAFTVGATDNTDKKAAFSSFGPCVEIWAPGVDITSLWKGPNGSTNKISGTSMATPHVAGVAALLAGEGDFSSPQQIYDALAKYATQGVVTGILPSTNTKNTGLLYNNVK